MRFTIVYDNESLAGFKRDWGFSCLVGDHVLFDTGADYSTLLCNMELLKISIHDIDTIVLSHAHGDHTGGIDIVRILDDVRVFVPKSFFSSMEKYLRRFENVRVVEVDALTTITEEILTTGEISGIEQSLVVGTPKGLVIVAGCSHPGLNVILNVSGNLGPIYGVIGGFHGFHDLDILRDIEMIIPCHCTRYKEQILARFPQTSTDCAAGRIFEI